MPEVTLNFDVVDDLAFAAERGRLCTNRIAELVAREVGPLAELELLSGAGAVPSPYSSTWLSLDGLAALGKALEAKETQWICPRSRMSGVLRTRCLGGRDTTIWTAFAVAAQSAATMVGFHRIIAAQLAATIDELCSNIFEHSESPDTGLIVFQARQRRFDFVVADHGIGVLKSLRSAEEYAGLDDHGQALQLALSHGVSRHGRDAQRGFGFRSLFVGLANLNGRLRFRSGDHALLIDGRSPTLMNAKTAQKAHIPGFFVSVSCEAGQ